MLLRPVLRITATGGYRTLWSCRRSLRPPRRGVLRARRRVSTPPSGRRGPATGRPVRWRAIRTTRGTSTSTMAMAPPSSTTTRRPSASRARFVAARSHWRSRSFSPMLRSVTRGALGGNEMMRQVSSRFCACTQYVLHVQWRDVLTAREMAAMTKHTQRFRSLMWATVLTFVGSGVALAQLASDANGNTKAGTNALSVNTAGTNNSVVGDAAMYTNSSGSNNTALGFDALYSNTSGKGNAAQGANSLYNNTTGIRNLGIGSNALLVTARAATTSPWVLTRATTRQRAPTTSISP